MKNVNFASVGLGALLAWGCAPATMHADAVVKTTEPASAGEMCGGIAGIGCAEGLYCDFGDGSESARSTCGSGDQTGQCAIEPQMCTTDYSPVCGCDGKTYGNACTAHAKGSTVSLPGECSTP